MAILLISNEEQNQVELNVTVEGADYYDLDINEVGPLPYWSSYFDPEFIASAVIKISSAVNLPTNTNITINVLFKKQTRQAQPNQCLGQIVDWYWDPLDNQTSSPLATVELFKQYRLWVTEGTNTSEVVPPAQRWKCIGSPDVVIESPDYLLQLGLSGNKIDGWGIYALIDNPSSVPPSPDITFIPEAPQIPLIIASSALFLIILIAMIVAHATDENSPSLKC